MMIYTSRFSGVSFRATEINDNQPLAAVFIRERDFTSDNSFSTHKYL